MNISTGVKAKLQKWMGKASTNVRDKRSASCQENAAEMTDYALQLQINNAMPVTHHSRTHSAPIPMNNGEKVVKKPRKSSISTPPSSFIKNQGNRENGKIDAYPKNGIPRGLTHSMVLHESSSEPSSSLQKQNNANCYSKELNLEDQTDSVAMNATRRAKTMDSNANATSSRALMKSNKPPSAVSKTSGEYSDGSASSDNEKNATNLVFESNPNDAQQLSGQIQSRLQKWVERASHQAALQDRRLSEESASSTDDSLNLPDSPKSKSSGSEPKSWTNESQVKKIKELELALKELVENVGVRGGNWPSKQGGTRSPGSSGQRSRNNSQKDSEELDENGNQGLLNKLARDHSESGLHKNRNSSSSTESDASVNMADGDAKLMIDNPEKSNELCSENQMEDLDDVTFKSSCPIRDQSRKYVLPHKNGRRSVTLQEVLLCETLIEQCPIQNNKDDQVKKITQTNGKKNHSNSVKNKGKGEYSLEATIVKNRSGKSELAERQNDTDNSKLLENSQNRSRDGPGKKLERPKLRKPVTDPDGSSLKIVPDSSVRESMRQYLKFKDADLSAFAVECVRHANKKKQILREGDVEKENLGDQTVQLSRKASANETNGAQSVQVAELQPIVIISSQDEDYKTDEAERSTTPTDSRRSSMDDETANKPVENERRSRYSFARTAEEAEWFSKEFIDPAQGNCVAKKETLERSSSNPQQDPVSSQRLYKFPSMPMFYIPNENVDSENGKQKKKETVNAPSAPLSPPRRSAASFPSALESLNTKPDPFYHGLSDSTCTTKQRANSSSVLTGKQPSEDENGNEVDKTSKRPKLRKRKMSAPSRSGLYPMTNVRVDIEALI